MTSSTPEAPEPGTQVDLEIIGRYVVDNWSRPDDEYNSAFLSGLADLYNGYTARQSPTVALTNDRDEEETR